MLKITISCAEIFPLFAIFLITSFNSADFLFTILLAKQIKFVKISILH